MFCDKPRDFISILRTFFKSSLASKTLTIKLRLYNGDYYHTHAGGVAAGSADAGSDCPASVASVAALPLQPPLSRHLYLVKDFGDDFVGADIVGFGLVCHADAVAQHIVSHGDDVLGNDEAALVQEGVSARGACQAD